MLRLEPVTQDHLMLSCAILSYVTGSKTISFDVRKRRERVRCSVLQCVAVCCSVLRCVAVCCSVLQHHDVGIFQDNII